MNISISLGWWLAPLAVTLVSFGWTIFTPAEPQSTGKYSLPDLMPLVRGAVSIIASLIAWLIWAVLK